MSVQARWRSLSRKARQALTVVLGSLALALAVPLALGLVAETYVLLPLRSSATAVPVIHVAEVWALGVLGLSCVVRWRPDLPRLALLPQLDVRELENVSLSSRQPMLPCAQRIGA